MALRLFGDGRIEEVSELEIEANTATDTPLTLIGATGQTANLLEVKNNAGTVVAKVEPDGDLAAVGGTFTGTVALPSTTSIGNVSSTEIGYLDNVTSAIQTQLNAKSSSASPTFTGQVVVPSGTASAPSISPSGDTNTGLFFPAADTIAFSEGGVEAMRIDSSGRVTMPYQPYFRAFANATTTSGNIVNYNAIISNVGNHYNTSTKAFTAPVSGVYYFEVHYLTERTSGTGDSGFDFYVNGSGVKRVYGGKSGTANLHIEDRGTLLIFLNANDSVQVYVYGIDGSSNIIANSAHCQFAGILV